VVYPVLEFREEKQTFVKVERGNVDFFLSALHDEGKMCF
jgi:hypothetical protein